LICYISGLNRSGWRDGQDNGVDGTGLDAQTAADTALSLIFKVGIIVKDSCPQAFTEPQAPHGTGLDAGDAGQAFVEIEPGLGPFGSFDPHAPLAGPIRNAAVRADPAAGAAFDTGHHIDPMGRLFFTRNGIGRADADTSAATRALLIDGIGHLFPSLVA
jgi:hypothetical protein